MWQRPFISSKVTYPITNIKTYHYIACIAIKRVYSVMVDIL